jgi:hypothetical protein
MDPIRPPPKTPQQPLKSPPQAPRLGGQLWGRPCPPILGGPNIGGPKYWAGPALPHIGGPCGQASNMGEGRLLPCGQSSQPGEATSGREEGNMGPRFGGCPTPSHANPVLSLGRAAKF